MTTATLSPPYRSSTQRHDALAVANAIRTGRARLKRDIYTERTPVEDILADPPELVDTMHVTDLLLAVRAVGRVRVNRMLRDCGISHAKTVGGLTPRQRKVLVQALWAEPVRARAREARRGR